MEQTAAIYLRSGAEDAGRSLETQRQHLTARAEAKGYRVVAEYSDARTPGTGLDRSGLQRLREKIRSRAVDVVLALDASRLARDVATQADLLKEAAEAGVTYDLD